MRRMFAVAGLLALIAALSRRYTRVEVSGVSMSPAFAPGDFLLVDRRAYRLHPPRPGDVVVAHDPRDFDRLLVKRVARVHADGALDLRGDAPETSTDSRQFGPVPPYLVEGRVVARYWPRPSLARRSSTRASVGNASGGGSAGSNHPSSLNSPSRR